MCANITKFTATLTDTLTVITTGYLIQQFLQPITLRFQGLVLELEFVELLQHLHLCIGFVARRWGLIHLPIIILLYCYYAYNSYQLINPSSISI